MKQIFLLLSFFVSLCAFSQSEKSSNHTQETTAIYANLKGEITGNVEVDYGNGEFVDLMTDEGRKFRSLVAALNYLSAKGWHVIAAFSESEEEDHYFLIEKKVSPEEAKVVIEKGIK